MDLARGNYFEHIMVRRLKLPIVYRFFLKQLNDLFCRQEEWNIGIWYKPIGECLLLDSQPEIRWLSGSKRGNYKADPFGIKREGKVYIFFEDFNARIHRGGISLVVIDEGGSISERTRVIESSVHMSYPYLFEHEGEVFCIPEMHDIPGVHLYKARRFPYDWVFVGTLVENVSVCDSTAFRYADRWWLTFTPISSCSEDLHVWYAPDLSGPWKPHAANPVKRDVSSARPAGTPFIFDGSLYRPAQDCSRTYGGRIVINKVIKLTEMEFDEETAATMGPFIRTPYPNGAHTLSSVGDFTLVDAKRMKFFISIFWQVFQHKVRKLFGSSKSG